MNIYLLSQDENDGYDTHDAIVVYAISEAEAKRMNPSGKMDKFCGDNWDASEWASSADNVTAKYLGKADGEVTLPGVILASFNAG